MNRSWKKVLGRLIKPNLWCSLRRPLEHRTRHAARLESLWQDFTEVSPHSSLKGRPPREYPEAVAGRYFPLLPMTGSGH